MSGTTHPTAPEKTSQVDDKVRDFAFDSGTRLDDEALDHGDKNKHANAKPTFPVWQWVLSLVGLYLGALLYGMYIWFLIDTVIIDT
jgi:hypothetical protein